MSTSSVLGRRARRPGAIPRRIARWPRQPLATARPIPVTPDLTDSVGGVQRAGYPHPLRRRPRQPRLSRSTGPSGRAF
jgi:hypothetical protein